MTDTELLRDKLAKAREGFAPCPTCKQYSHSIGANKLAEAYRHFHTMEAHPVRGHPMGFMFDEKTRDAVEVVLAAIEGLQPELDAANVPDFNEQDHWEETGTTRAHASDE